MKQKLKNEIEHERYIDKNGYIAYIPDGFKISENERERVISNGLVVLDKYDNEFIWIPVPNFDEFVRKEPVYINKEVKWEIIDDSKYTEEKTDEYIEMMESVKKYKGFYLARYCACVENKQTIEEIIQQQEDIRLLSKKNKYIINYVTLEIAKKLSNNFYKESDNLNVVSTLCYGVQFDSVMQFLSNVPNKHTKDNKPYIIDSKRMGYYRDYYYYDIRISGMNETYMVKNIHDLAGKCLQLTHEVKKNKVVLRGGLRNSNGTGSPVSRRIVYDKNSTFHLVSFRNCIYLE